MSDLRQRDELWVYTLQRGDAFFIHQVAADAYALQYATADMKPIAIAFALIGLCLVLERGKTGREAQLAHMRYATPRKIWPHFHLPHDRGSVTIADVLKEKPGDARDRAILRWALSVWQAWESAHNEVRRLLDHPDAMS